MNKYYLGQPFTVTDKNFEVNIDVPIDPTNSLITSKQKGKIIFSMIIDSVVFFLLKAMLPLLISGTLLTAFTAVIYPNKNNIIFVTLYFAISVIYIVTSLLKSRQYGVVYDFETRKPIANAMVSIYDKKYNSLKESRMTDRFGRFSIYAQPDEYYLLVSARDYKFPVDTTNLNKQKYYAGQVFQIKTSSFIRLKIPMQKT